MTLQSPASEVTHQGNGVTTVFPYSFRIDAADEAVVYLTDRTVTPEVTTTLSSLSYSISGIGNDAGGNVTYNPGPPLPAQHYITIQRNAPYTQETDITNQGAYLPETLEGALDRIVMQTQQLKDGLNRAVLVPVGSSLDPDDYLGTIQDAANAAALSETNAANSAATASTQSGIAATQAGIATTQAGIATTQASTATTQAGIATTQATNAANSATAADLSADIADAASAWQYNFSSTTTSGDPGAGAFRFNNATLSSVTALYISETTAIAQNIAADIAFWDNSTSVAKGKLKFTKRSDPTVFAGYYITGTVTDNGSWDSFTLNYITGNGTFTNGDSVSIQFTPNGDAGSGTVVSELRWADTVAGSATNVDLTFSPPIGGLGDGQLIVYRSGFASVANVNVSSDGGGYIPLRKLNNAPTANGDFFQNDNLLLSYNSTLGIWNILSATNKFLYGVVASAASIALPSGATFVNVTGTTGIGAITNIFDGQTVILRHNGTLTYTASGTMLLPYGAATLTVNSGDMVVVYRDGSGFTRISHVHRATQAAARSDLGITLGTAANNVVQLDGSARLPAVDGSQLTGIPNVFVDMASVTLSGSFSSANIIPSDGTTPQISEGAEAMNVSITPKSTTNKLVVMWHGWGSCSANTPMIAALFQDSVANALASTAFGLGSGSASSQIAGTLTHIFTPGTTSAITLRIRVGPGTAATMYLNSVNGSGILGANATSTLAIFEIKA